VQFRTTRFRSEIDPIIGGDDHALFAESLAFSIKVEGEPLKESGTGEAWRLARLKWLDSKIGESDTEVTRPFTPIRVGAATRTLGILGRNITLGESGVPAQFTSFFSESNTRILDKGRDAFASAPSLEVVIGGKSVKLKPSNFKFTKQTPVGVEWEAVNSTPDLSLLVKGRLEFDGNLRLAMTLTSESKTNAAWIEGVPVDDVRFIVPFAKGVTKYAMGLGLQGGLAPEKLDWKWDTRKNQDALWLGDANIGTMLRFKGGNYRRPLINAYYAFQPLNLPESWGGGGIRIANDADHAAMLTAYSGPKKVTTLGKGEGGLHFDIDFYLTPFKPLDVKQHFTDRYYHAKQGASNEDTAKLHADGANILEVHHNRPCNPYINYPFNDDSFGSLKDFIGKAHADDMRVGVYYTNRELTQNLPEFFALKSLDGEVILKRKEGVAWPVTNSGGPHPWLKQHVGEDIVPAWRENLKFPQYKSSLDLAVITTPDSRWNNFYLEGLDYLVKKAGIDGLYIDDTALDRKSMQRARRILDADGNTGRRVNMHSWNHFNGLAAWANSSIAFMELYPYYNGLWHGESFNADASPEFMLVEISGIPYGLMSEMLDHPNPWHGMVFGMRTRWPWSGDPREQWKFEESFGIADSEFIGWWDANNPIKVDKTDPADPARVIASVYKKQGKTLVALGNWGKATKIKLTADWKALGLDAGKVKLHAPEIKGFQPEQTFAPGDEISVEASRGWMLIVE
ncbi:MAG: glycoside hydrolase domain-containing protein, partial [Luteolibacter sp.]